MRFANAIVTSDQQIARVNVGPQRRVVVSHEPQRTAQIQGHLDDLHMVDPLTGLVGVLAFDLESGQ
jgi:hypothetical protein